MASVGLFVDLNLKIIENYQVQQVREDIVKRLECPGARVDMYRLSPLRAYEDVSPSDLLVAHVPQLQMIRQESHDLLVESLTSQLQELRAQICQSEKMRQEAVEAIDAVRDEFLAMLQEMNGNGSDLQSPIKRYAETIRVRNNHRKRDAQASTHTS